MRRRTRGLFLPAVVLSAVASAGVVTILLGAGTLPDELPTLRVKRGTERRSTSVTATPTPRPTPSRTPSAAPTVEPTSVSSTTRPPRTSSPSTTPTAVTPTASCKAGSATVRAASDTYVDQSVPKKNFGSDDVLSVASRDKSRNRRALVRFALPVVPKGCTLRSATLTLTPREASGRRLLVSRAGRGWNEGTVTWNDAPAPWGAAASATVSGAKVRWTVTQQVAAMLGGPNYGFLVRDAAENASGAGASTSFAARQTGSGAASLTLTWS